MGSTSAHMWAKMVPRQGPPWGRSLVDDLLDAAERLSTMGAKLGPGDVIDVVDVERGDV